MATADNLATQMSTFLPYSDEPLSPGANAEVDAVLDEPEVPMEMSGRRGMSVIIAL